MGNKINYSRQTQKIIESLQENRDRGELPRLLLHSCCAPCSSHCMEYLREYFDLTVFYYNPNITIAGEYEKRLAEEKRLIEAYNLQVEEQSFADMHSTPAAGKIGILEAPYDPQKWFERVRGLESCRREETDVLSALRCGSGRPRRQLQREDLIISPRPSRSVPSKMLKGSTG